MLRVVAAGRRPGDGDDAAGDDGARSRRGRSIRARRRERAAGGGVGSRGHGGAAPRRRRPRRAAAPRRAKATTTSPGPGRRRRRCRRRSTRRATRAWSSAARPATRCCAAADGRVVYAGSGLRGYGNLVILKHNTTYLTAYAHNQTLLVKEDQTVKRGQKIAEMGSTDADSVQLHFEIRQPGQADRSGAPAAAALAAARRRRWPPVLAFDIETIPDVAGLRLLRGADPAPSDAEVYAAEIADRAARNKSDFMPLYLQRVLVISLRLPHAGRSLQVRSFVDRERDGKSEEGERHPGVLRP